MQSEGDLIAGGVAAVASDLDVCLFLDSRISTALGGLPQFDLDYIGFQIVQD